MTEQNAKGPFPDVEDGLINDHIIKQWFSFWRHELTKRGGSMSAWRAETIDRIEGLALDGLVAAAGGQEACHLKEAKANGVCRVCGENASPRRLADGSNDPFVLDFGREFAHQSCLANARGTSPVYS